MDIIQLLPDSVANQIAAGEVIQRPASVIKELVENAIDAGATTIQVLVVDAGRTSIQVIDDGCGMSDTDARLSFERHATSKIRKADDLFALHTMGFRGEALASIAAVAQVTLTTKMKDEELGTCVKIAGGRVTNQEIVSCPTGSNFLIENLFYNVPARRKFLKSNATEMSNITQAFERIVLVYPGVHFELYNNGQQMLDLHAGTLKQRIVDVFGKKLNQQLLPIDTDTTLCKLTGFVGKPESSKKKGAQQFFFVNGRYMKHPYFHKAVQMAFDRLIPTGEQVPYFVYFTVPPEDIDVNIHPVKTEIKFENEAAIWQIVLAAVRDAVGKFSGITELDFNTDNMPDIPVYNQTKPSTAHTPKVEFNPNYNPFNTINGSNSGGGFSNGGGSCSGGRSNNGGDSYISNAAKQTKNWEQLYSKLDTVRQSSLDMEAEQGELFSSSIIGTEEQQQNPYEDISAEHLQYRGSYIMTQVSGGLMVVDQHRADVCVLYDEYMKQLASKASHTQKILFPELIQFPPSYTSKLAEVFGTLRFLGFEITDMGGGSYAIGGVPAGLAGLDPVILVNELVTVAIEMNTDIKDEVNSKLALELAYRAATPYGEVLDNATMDKIVRQLLQCKNQNYTPDGKPVIVLLGNDDLESKFKKR